LHFAFIKKNPSGVSVFVKIGKRKSREIDGIAHPREKKAKLERRIEEVSEVRRMYGCCCRGTMKMKKICFIRSWWVVPDNNPSDNYKG
jgi:hypothetical protein